MNVESHKGTWPSRLPSLKSMLWNLHIWAQGSKYSTPNLSLPHLVPGLIWFFEFYIWGLPGLQISLPMLCSVLSDKIPKLGYFKKKYTCLRALEAGILEGMTPQMLSLLCHNMWQDWASWQRRECFSNQATPLATQSPLIPE